MGRTSTRLIYQVAVGNVPGFYSDCIESVAEYARAIGAEHTVQVAPALRISPMRSQRSTAALKFGYLPIYEKETAFALLEDYDKVLVLDADVFVKQGSPNVFELSDMPFAGVVERDMPLTAAYRQKVRKHSIGQFDRLRDVNWNWDDRGADYFNMGVMLLDRSILPYLRGQSPGEFLRRPEFERFINGEGHWRWSTDQTLLNWWLRSDGIPTQHINWRWNGLYGANPCALEAHFVHFFLSAKLPRKGAEIPEIIGSLL